jgi:hypothetical protein
LVDQFCDERCVHSGTHLSLLRGWLVRRSWRRGMRIRTVDTPLSFRAHTENRSSVPHERGLG